MEKRNIVKPNFSKNKVNKENLNNERKVVEKEATVEINQETKSKSILEQAKLLNEQDNIIKNKEKKKMEKIAYLLAGLVGAVVITAVAVFGLLKVSNIQEVAKQPTQVEVTDSNAKEKGIELTDEIKQEYTEKIKNVLNEEAKKFYSEKEAYGATYNQFLDLYQWYRLEGFSESSSYQLVLDYLKNHTDGAVELNDSTKKELQELADNKDKLANYGEAIPEEVDQNSENVESAGDMNGDTSEGVEISEELKNYNESPESQVTEEDNIAEWSEEPKQEEVYTPAPEVKVDDTPTSEPTPAPEPAPEDSSNSNSGSDDSFWGSDGGFTDSWNNIDSTEHGSTGWDPAGGWNW
mgnify:CR=1 FL=1